LPKIIEVRVHSKFGGKDGPWTVSVIDSDGMQVINKRECSSEDEAEIFKEGIEQGISLLNFKGEWICQT